MARLSKELVEESRRAWAEGTLALAPEATWRELEKAIGVPSPCDELRRGIWMTVRIHYLGLDAGVPKLTNAALKKWAQKIRNQAEQLRQLITIDNDGDQNAASANEWARAKVCVALLPNEYTSRDLEYIAPEEPCLRDILQSLIERANVGLKEIETEVEQKKMARARARARGSKMRQHDIPTLAPIITTLAAYYEKVTGKPAAVSYDSPARKRSPKQYGGPFFRMVKVFFDDIAVRLPNAPTVPKTNNGLGEQIKRSLRARRTFRARAG